MKLAVTSTVDAVGRGRSSGSTIYYMYIDTEQRDYNYRRFGTNSFENITTKGVLTINLPPGKTEREANENLDTIEVRGEVGGIWAAKFLDRTFRKSLRVLTVCHTISIERIVYCERGRLRDDAAATRIAVGINGIRGFKLGLRIRLSEERCEEVHWRGCV
jgi:hypothetical protein